MISDLDLWRGADILVKRYGNDASIIAAQRADEVLAGGDIEGQLVWKRILAAVNELQRTKLAVNERRH
ncbi:MAG: hypothetical protein ACRELG_26290 [Gemmataceae bacterium]